MDTIRGIFNQMVGQGWTLVAASGDSGPTAAITVNGNQVCDTRDRVNYPASDPDVVGVGGTTLTWLNGKYLSETGWTGGTSPGSCNRNNGGSGGGCSAKFVRPGYQTNKDCPSSTVTCAQYRTCR
jgi:kumamolisin